MVAQFINIGSKYLKYFFIKFSTNSHQKYVHIKSTEYQSYRLYLYILMWKLLHLKLETKSLFRTNFIATHKSSDPVAQNLSIHFSFQSNDNLMKA